MLNGDARPAANLAKGVQVCRPRRTKEGLPGIGANAHDAGEARLEVAKFDGAQQGAEVAAERADGSAASRAWIQRRDQEDRGAGE